MTAPDLAHLRALANAASEWIEQENVGRPYMPDYQPTADSKAFYEAAHTAVPALCDEVERLRANVEAADERMAAVLDGTFSVGDGTAQKEIERLRAAADGARFAGRVEGEELHLTHAVEDAVTIARLRKLLAEACDIAEQQDGRDSAVERITAIRAAAAGSVKP